MPTYFVSPIAKLAHSNRAISTFPTDIAKEHRAFFPEGVDSSYVEDRRPVEYRFGHGIAEPAIAERWEQYEASYLNTRRLTDFWCATIEHATVEPSSLMVMSGSAVVRETVRLAKHLREVFQDVSEDDLRRSIKDPSRGFDSSLVVEPSREIDEALLFSSGIFQNYYNWTIRYAVRLRIIDALGSGMKILMPQSQKEHIGSTLEFFGVPMDRVVLVTAPQRVNKLHVVSPVANGRYELSPSMIANIRSHPAVLGLEDSGDNKLFIPRRNVRIRRVVNEVAVLKALQPLGFTVFDNAVHSIREQARRFRNANLIVAPHGAGLANIVYCRPGATVVEIIPEGYDQGVTSYRSLADLFGLKYVPLFAREVVPKPNRCNSDIEIDVDELLDVVRDPAAATA